MLVIRKHIAPLASLRTPLRHFVVCTMMVGLSSCFELKQFVKGFEAKATQVGENSTPSPDDHARNFGKRSAKARKKPSFSGTVVARKGRKEAKKQKSVALALAAPNYSSPVTLPTEVTDIATLRQSIVSFGQTLTGVRYRYAGTSPEGFDCSGFVHYCMKNYGVQISPAGVAQSLSGKYIELAEAKAGDLLFFSRSGTGGPVTHVALVVENKPEGIICVHASSSKGVIVQNMTADKYWKPKLLYARDVLSR